MIPEKLAKEKLILRLLEINLFSICLSLFLLILKRTALPDKVPLFYSRPWGEEQLATSYYLFLIPLFSLIILIVFFQLTQILLKKGEKFLALLSDSFALLFSVLGTITVIKIIFLIT